MDFSLGENQQAVIEAAAGVLGQAGSTGEPGNDYDRARPATTASVPGLGLPRVPR